MNQDYKHYSLATYSIMIVSLVSLLVSYAISYNSGQSELMATIAGLLILTIHVAIPIIVVNALGIDNHNITTLRPPTTPTSGTTAIQTRSLWDDISRNNADGTTPPEDNIVNYLRTLDDIQWIDEPIPDNTTVARYIPGNRTARYVTDNTVVGHMTTVYDRTYNDLDEELSAVQAQFEPVIRTDTPHCPVCGDCLSLMVDNITSCDQCETLHHHDCWELFEKCSIYGCGCAKPSAIMMVSALEN